MKNFSGKVLFLDRSDINTDEIIPAKYLTEISKEALKAHCLEDLALPGFDPARDVPGRGVIVTRSNFGCGSSREHAPWALEINGINVVIAESFARIFRQNMFNNGMLAVELPKKDVDELFRLKADDARVEVRFDDRKVLFTGGPGERQFVFRISGFDSELVKAGGWVEFADKRY
jgi:3-isopropylmalate/(R)-2-methylmalate dehydratase small subunit